MTDYIYNQDGIKVRPSTQEDVDFLKHRLRKSDIDEVWASDHIAPEEALQQSFLRALQSFTIENGQPIGMFGINSEDLIDQKARIWLLASNDLDKIKIRFLINCRKYIQMFLNIVPYLENWVDIRNTRYINWLHFCGATFDKPERYGPDELTFQHFYFKKDNKSLEEMKIHKSLSMIKKIQLFSEMLKKAPGAKLNEHPDSPVSHHFGGGMYVRELFIPKGMVGVGKMHRHEHPSFLMKGEISVFSSETGLQRLKAPRIIVSKPGTQRVGFAHEDTIWATVHLNPKNHSNVDLIEDEVIVKNPQEFIEFADLLKIEEDSK